MGVEVCSEVGYMERECEVWAVRCDGEERGSERDAENRKMEMPFGVVDPFF